MPPQQQHRPVLLQASGLQQPQRLLDHDESKTATATDPIPTTADRVVLLTTAASLTLFVAAVIYFAMIVPSNDNTLNTKFGLASGGFVILVMGQLVFKDGPFIRPHPAFWKLILAAGVAYQIALLFLLFQTKTNARALLQYFDSSLGVPPPEKNYATDCSVTWKTLHVSIGLARLLALLDCINSFEVMEYSLEHHLPNFAECWWDHWILDVLVTNWIGTYLGMKACEYFEVKHYSWRGMGEIPTIQGKLARTVGQFTPHSWTKFEWGSTKTIRNFVAVIGILYLELQCELNAFYLKYLLWIPISHPINLVRLLFFFFMCLPAVREAYQYLTDPHGKKLLLHAWVTALTIITELLIIIKFSEGEFSENAPWHIIALWVVLLSTLVGYAIWQFTCPLLAGSSPTLKSGAGKTETHLVQMRKDIHPKSTKHRQ
ncbi:hypothetical protein BASA60_009905 [Batrachochytrium salamandrivorans]|nr:hypothetical protein BASA60_009905 [Batrachochytrium salamandrivorans]